MVPEPVHVLHHELHGGSHTDLLSEGPREGVREESKELGG